MLTHPGCGKEYPSNNTHGHCDSCCETFSGLAAFDAHRVGEYGVDRRCEIQPYEVEGRKSFGHWQDDKGYWHYGKKLSAEDKERIWG